jgi:hypothetical protein
LAIWIEPRKQSRLVRAGEPPIHLKRTHRAPTKATRHRNGSMEEVARGTDFPQAEPAETVAAR